jgi:Tfp pilus assembly protein PilX
MNGLKGSCSRAKGRSRDCGVALILVLLSMLVLSVLAATIVFTARSETLASYNFKLDTQADYLAKAGIQYAVNWFRSTHYKGVPHSQANTYYSVASTGDPWNLWTSKTSAVTCISGCSSTNSGVQLINYGSGSSNYPSINNTEGTPRAVATAFASDLNNVRVTGDANNSGTFSINAILLNYQTVMVGAPPAGSILPVETWLITSRATWTGGSSMTGTVATAEEQAVIQPIYVPTWGNALYGFCSVAMSGSAGTCTDAFNSALGAYGGGNKSVASGACDSTSATNVIAAGAGVGSNGGVTLGSNVTVSGDVTIGSGPPAGCTASGFTGNASSVLGQVINGPHKNPPAVPTFRTTPAFPTGGTGAPTYSLGTNDVKILPLSVTTWPSLATFPNTSHTPPLTAGGPCMDTSCTGAVDHPYEITSVSMTGGGKGGNAPKLQLIGGPDPFNPVYYDIDSLSQNQGSIEVSGYVVLNVKTSLSIGGNGISNGITSSIPPECVQMNYAGTNAVTINGNGAVSAVLNAPDAAVDLGGGGSAGYMVGAIQAKNVNVQGGYPVHYDVQLSKVGGVMGVPVTTAYNRKKM